MIISLCRRIGVLHSPPLKLNSSSNSFRSPQKQRVQIYTNQRMKCSLHFSSDNLTTLYNGHSIRRNLVCQHTCVPLYMTRNSNPHVTHLCRYFVLTHPRKDSSIYVDILRFTL